MVRAPSYGWARPLKLHSCVIAMRVQRAAELPRLLGNCQFTIPAHSSRLVILIASGSGALVF